MFCVSCYDQAVKSLEQDVPLYSVFPCPLQQPAFGLSFPRAEAVHVTPCPSFILYVAALVSNANRGSSRELLSSRKQALTKTFVHHQEIYSYPIPQQTSMGNHQ